MFDKRLKGPERNKIIKQILKENKNNKELIKKMASDLLEDNNHFVKTYIGSFILLGIKDEIDKEMFRNLIYKLADSKSWEVRETAAMILRALLLYDFEYYFKVAKEMVKDKRTNIKRGAVVGSMQSKLNKEQTEKIAKYIYEPVLTNNEVYITKNLGPFAISNMLRCQPDLTFKFFFEWIKTQNPRIIWNILNAFQLSRIKKNERILKEAQKYLKMAESMEDKTIQNAVKSLKRRIYSIK